MKRHRAIDIRDGLCDERMRMFACVNALIKASVDKKIGEVDPPDNISEFTELYDLIDDNPELIETLKAMPDMYPGWQLFVDKWDEMSRLYKDGRRVELSVIIIDDDESLSDSMQQLFDEFSLDIENKNHHILVSSYLFTTCQSLGNCKTSIRYASICTELNIEQSEKQWALDLLKRG